MANGLNKVMIIGNLGADPELRVTQGGEAVLNLRVACTESFMNRNNERQERTEWVQCTLWGKRAEALVKFLAKGSKVYVEGSLRTETYEKDGEKRYATKVNVREIILCGEPRGQGHDQGESEGHEQGPAQPRPGAQGAWAADAVQDGARAQAGRGYGGNTTQRGQAGQAPVGRGAPQARAPHPAAAPDAGFDTYGDGAGYGNDEIPF